MPEDEVQRASEACQDRRLEHYEEDRKVVEQPPPTRGAWPATALTTQAHAAPASRPTRG